MRIHAEDGRNCIRRSDERYDLIIADLFTPWKAGTGNLYTLEHYRTARDRLEAGGMYVQWLPLYQVSDRGLGTIARTMDEAFERVVLWRGDLFSSRSIVALVGHAAPEALDPAVLSRQGRAHPIRGARRRLLRSRRAAPLRGEPRAGCSRDGRPTPTPTL